VGIRELKETTFLLLCRCLASENNPQIYKNKRDANDKITPHHNRNTGKSQKPRGNQNPYTQEKLNPVSRHT
jgi:hypothetical protein